MINDNEQRIKDKLDFFMSEKVKIHIKLTDRTFLNGYIEKECKEGVYWFIDDKLPGVFLFLKDIFEIKEFTEVRDKGVEDGRGI